MNSCLRNLSTTLLILQWAGYVHGQVIQTGKTDNSIVVKNTNAGFDVGQSEVNLSFTNYFKAVVPNHGGIWGVTAKAKNANGLAAWFQSGDFQPSSSLNGVLGYYWTSVPDQPPIKNDAILSDSLLALELARISAEIRTRFRTLIKSPVYGLTDDQKTAERLAVETQLKKPVAPFKALENDLKKKVLNTTGVDGLDELHQDMLTALTTAPLKEEIADFFKPQLHLNAGEESISTILSRRVFWTLKAYGTFGMNSDQFSLFHSWDSTNLSKNFTTENFRGGNIGAGFNFSWRGTWMLGVMDRYEESNNVGLLSSKTYTLETTITDSNQTAKSKKDITAYAASDYSKVYFNSLYIDVMRYFALPKDSVFIVADLYFRHKSSNNQIAYASNSTLGLSGALFKSSGKFFGGLYLELPDINQKLAKMDPTYVSKPFYNRLTFGVYAKISFASLLKAL